MAIGMSLLEETEYDPDAYPTRRRATSRTDPALCPD